MAGLRRRRTVEEPSEALVRRHLLLVPTVATVDQVDALVRCWYPGSDLAGTGTADLGGRAGLHGPHELTMEAAVVAGVPTPWSVAYDLEVDASPRARAVPVRRPDGLHRCFPDGLPTGAELAGLELLLALARRLGGAVRPIGAAEALVPEVAAAVETRVVSPTWIRVADVAAVCGQEGAGVEVAVEGETGPEALARPDGTPFLVHLPLGPAGAVVVEGAVAVRPEPAVAGEEFGAGPMAVYDVRWQAPDEQWHLDEHLEGTAMACRERARGPVASITRTLAELGGGAVVDADGFLVDPDDL
ncbi:hypothetical protein [Aquipuribacter hungaricus]|uniref:Uncharacterized protein n=1 Tax=Aquipuribacter hungaricus TaxID=545624 RepID=A0ABV7WGJ3_9MICO